MPRMSATARKLARRSGRPRRRDRAALGRRPQDDGRVRLLERPAARRDALGPHAAQPARARAIVSVDIAAALAMPGVHAVLTHEDVPGQKTYGLEFPDQPVLAVDRVRYVGEPVALVAAEHPSRRGAPRRRSASSTSRCRPSSTRSARPSRSRCTPDRPTMGHGYRDDPAAERRPPHRDPPRRPGGRRAT